jgi:tRNA nucleotidyltransferase (CCA-adding enzyme)
MKKTTKSSGARLKSGAVTTKNKSKSSCISEIVALEKKESLPDKEVILKINKFIDALNKALKQQKIDAEASMGGSVAKGTFIKNSFDADIFVKFHPKFRGQNISDILDSVLKKMKLEANRVHGSRDYFQIKKEFTYELVPVLNVNDYRQAENVADMSPLHVLYFIKQSRKIKNLREEIRVTKLFMKSARVYEQKAT